MQQDIRTEIELIACKMTLNIYLYLQSEGCIASIIFSKRFTNYLTCPSYSQFGTEVDKRYTNNMSSCELFYTRARVCTRWPVKTQPDF